ncbi:MAG: hypothetical protein OQK00_09105 [Rhodobacteraceae bacterium]|nr:hypothetical protein [Paracoccaceae bacterium]MCW9044221.1 hypothetical protein [Pseudopelagicola sp.]
MRRVMHGDVVAAARVLFALPNAMRADTCRRMIVEADAAHRYFKRFDHSHSLWGDGSLMAAAGQRPMPPEPGFGDLDYCRCFEQVLTALIDWRLSRMHSRYSA